MSVTLFYEKNDELEKYVSGQSISPWNKSWSLLFFKASNLDFSIYGKSLTSRIANHLYNNNFIYIGDIVSRPLQEILCDQNRHTGLGVKSENALNSVITRLGLAFKLNIFGGWPPKDELELPFYPYKPARPNPLTRYIAHIAKS